MTEQEIIHLIKKQHRYFSSGATLDISFRIRALNRLKTAILLHEDDLHAAIRKDLGKAALKATCAKRGLSSVRSPICSGTSVLWQKKRP